MATINPDDFWNVELRAGTIVRVEDFPEARKPAYQVWVDFGEPLGVRKTSAQITDLYAKENLLGRQIVGVVNLPPKQVGPFMSEFLLTGFVGADEAVVLAVPERRVADGSRLT